MITKRRIAIWGETKTHKIRAMRMAAIRFQKRMREGVQYLRFPILSHSHLFSRTFKFTSCGGPRRSRVGAPGLGPTQAGTPLGEVAGLVSALKKRGK